MAKATTRKDGEKTVKIGNDEFTYTGRIRVGENLDKTIKEKFPNASEPQLKKLVEHFKKIKKGKTSKKGMDIATLTNEKTYAGIAYEDLPKIVEVIEEIIEGRAAERIKQLQSEIKEKQQELDDLAKSNK